MTSFEPHRGRKIAALFGAALHALASLTTVVLVARGWVTIGSGSVAGMLFLSLAVLHVWGFAQFGTLRITSAGLELQRWRPVVFTWEQLRLTHDDSRRLVIQTPDGVLRLYPSAFQSPTAVREAVVDRLRAGRAT